MRIWTVVWLFVVAVVGTFVVANWGVLTAQTDINLILAQVTAPLGLVMIGALAVLTLLGLFFVVWLETRALLQLGRAGRPSGEPGGEALAELRAHLDRQLGDLKGQTAASADNLFARLDHVEQVVKDLAQRVGHKDVS